MERPLKILRDVVVLVEGADEFNFLIELCKARNLPDVQFIDYGGKAQLPVKLRTIVKLPGFADVKRLGVIRDADGDCASALASVRSALKAADLSAPQTELVLHNGNPATAIFISPGNGAGGELEDALLASVHGHTALPCIDALLGCIAKNTNIQIKKKQKATVRAFLACQSEALDHISDGAKKGVWPLSHAAFDGFAQLISLIGAAPTTQ